MMCKLASRPGDLVSPSESHKTHAPSWKSTQVAEPRVPLFESGQPDLAERVDEALDGFGER